MQCHSCRYYTVVCARYTEIWELRIVQCHSRSRRYYIVLDSIWRSENSILCNVIHADTTLFWIYRGLRTPYCTMSFTQILYCARYAEIWELRIAQCHPCSRRYYIVLDIRRSENSILRSDICARYTEIWELHIAEWHSWRSCNIANIWRSENSILRSDIHTDTALR